MYDKNNIGPRMVPYGAPETTGAYSGKVPLTTTRCLWQVRKCLSQLNKFPSRPRLRNLISRRSWGTCTSPCLSFSCRCCCFSCSSPWICLLLPWPLCLLLARLLRLLLPHLRPLLPRPALLLLPRPALLLLPPICHFPPPRLLLPPRPFLPCLIRHLLLPHPLRPFGEITEIFLLQTFSM